MENIARLRRLWLSWRNPASAAFVSKRNSSSMTAQTARSPTLFVMAAFTGAALIFFVQPMAAKLMLPLLGGSPAVWNTSMAFFQAALLAGYGYAHLLQRLSSIRTQALVHVAVLLVAGLALPLRVTQLLGEPSSTMPALWLLGVLAVSIGAPFAALAATAPLVQAWHARVFGGREGGPWGLYAASNLGSLIALLAYPVIVEPTVTLAGQRYGWSAAYVLFVLVMAALSFTAARAGGPAPRAEAGGRVGWKDRLTWLALAALPSSLMLGVTSHLATDVASAPFLWVVPLALYLVTFIIAFQTRPAVPPGYALLLQAALLPVCAFMLPIGGPILLQFAVHLGCFFLTALVCHQALVARRPDPARLTEFYLWMSLGGVVGGAFNAFVAPLIFNSVVEYPLVLVLAALARPWRNGRLTTWQIGIAVIAVLAAVTAGWLVRHPPQDILNFKTYDTLKVVLLVTVVAVFLLRRNLAVFVAMMAVLSLAAHAVGQRQAVIASDRSFFGVLRQSWFDVPRMGGPVRLLAHGTTLHGAQAQDPRYRCRPLVYYAPETAIGQVFTSVRARKAAMDVAAVGLGTGAVAAYMRPGDRLTFFEIDPLVVAITTNPRNFTYVSECAKGRIDYVIGDARLTLARQPASAFDLLLVDAFSSDAIPAHLLTVEAMRTYLSRIKPDGVVILHLSNRHLELHGPANAVAKAAGGVSLEQRYRKADSATSMWESSENVVIVGRSAAALAPYRAAPYWEIPPLSRSRPWTDDYTNLPGALWAELTARD
jgi:SAM-dependent methyltransferase